MYKYCGKKKKKLMFTHKLCANVIDSIVSV